MTPLNDDPTRWDEHGKREVPSDVYDGTGEAGGGDALREALAEVLVALDVFRRGEGEFPDLDSWETKARAALTPLTESVKAPEGVTQADKAGDGVREMVVARIIHPAAFSETFVNRKAAVWGSAKDAENYQVLLRTEALKKADAILAALTTNAPEANDAVAKERKRVEAQAKYLDMDIEERAVAMADDGEGNPWELLGFFREKLRQSVANAESAKEAAIRIGLELRAIRSSTPDAEEAATDAASGGGA